MFVRALGAASVVLVSTLSSAQTNPRAVASMAEGRIQVEFGRPSAKGRDVLGMIQPDSYWRMGADAPTTLETSVPLIVGESRLEPGKYTLLGHFAASDEFFLVIAKGMSGSLPKDVAGRVEGRIERGQPPVELLTIDLEGTPGDAALVLSWGESRIRTPFRVAP